MSSFILIESLKRTMTKVSALALMLAAGLMTGCDSSGGSSSTKTGVFHDAVVSGISYKASPSGKSGVTDAKGKFDYKEGDSITFSIGSIVFPSGVPQDGIITPAHLAGTADWQNSDIAINIIRFLMTIDVDGDPSNGIQIPEGAADLADEEIDFSDNGAFTLAAETFFDALALVDAFTYDYTEIVTAIAAEDHFANTLVDLDIEIEIEILASQLVGSWYYTEDAESETEQVHIVLTFLDNNTYVIANDEADADESGQDGFEIGSYSLSSSGIFEATVLEDTNGEWGFSDPCEGEILKFELLGDTLKLSADGEVGEACSGEGADDIIELKRVKSSSDDLVGSWLIDIDLANNEFALVSFMENGTYMQVQNSTADESGAPGIERGEYEINTETDAVIFTAITDTNNQWGFSHPCAILFEEATPNYANPGYLNCGDGDAAIVQTLEVNVDTLTFISEADTIANDDVEDPVELVRVK